MARQLIPYSLRRHEAFRPGLIRILNKMGRDARALSEQPESKLSDTIHDLRTLIKRLRAYFWFLRPALGRKLHALSNATLRKAAQQLSKTRDLHAVASALTKSVSPTTHESHRQALAQVSQAFIRQAKALQKSDNSFHALEKVADMVTETIPPIVRTAGRNVEAWPSPTQRISKAFKRTRKAMKNSLRKKDPQFVHEWRKKTKKLYYLLQLTANLPHAGMPESIKKVDKLQELLGDFQDGIVAENHLRQNPPEVNEAHLKQAFCLLRKNRKTLLKDARHAWAAVVENI